MINGLAIFKRTGGTEYALRDIIKPSVEGDEIDIIHGSLLTETEYTRIVGRELGRERGSMYEQIYELAKEIKPKFLFFEMGRSWHLGTTYVKDEDTGIVTGKQF